MDISSRLAAARQRWTRLRRTRAVRIGVRPFAFLLVMALTAGLIALGLLPFIGGAGYAVKQVDQKFLGKTTVPLTIPTLPSRSTLYAANGSVLANVWLTYNRKIVPLKQVNEISRQAVLAIEDHGFYEHGPIDVPSIVRALVANLRAGGVVQGASTITQQLVKNTEVGNAVTISRKIKEAQDAIRLQQKYTKDQILEAYLNQVYLGNGVYGIGTAAEWYFGERVDKLTLPQAALLAGMINAPADLDPIHHATAALARRNFVLARMLDLHWITQSQYDDAIQTRIKLRSSMRNVVRQPKWVQYVVNSFLADPRFGATYEDRVHALFQGGLKIYTTLNPRFQEAAENAIKSHLYGAGMPQAALVSVVPQTGAIVAAADGNYAWPKHKFYLAMQGHRTAGSAFKAFTLATALSEGISPDSVFNGNSPKTIPNCGGGETWTVHNAEPGGGNYSLWAATADSVNAVFAQVINEVGPQNVADTARAMGIRTPLTPVCPLTLGTTGLGVTPLEMTAAYSTLPNGGQHCLPYSISRIADSSGATVFRARPRCTEAITPQVASLETQMLQGVISGGTGTAAQLCPSDCRPEAGKTGTGDDFQDAWFMGYIRQLTAGVWVGYEKCECPMRAVPRYGEGFGGVLAAPIWHQYMLAVTRHMPVRDFLHAGRPPIKSGTVPNVVGKTQAEATSILAKAKYAAIVKLAPSNQPSGIVFKQDPGGGSSAPIGTGVTIWVSNGQKPKPPPTHSPPPTHTPSPTPTQTSSPTEGPPPGPGAGPAAGMPLWPALSVLIPAVVLPVWRRRGRGSR
ncbi:MAG TPA: transglycosylase domain-containing protein [Actinomycetota bacterium]|jgi:penicillin-binding protein 1A